MYIYIYICIYIYIFVYLYIIWVILKVYMGDGLTKGITSSVPNAAVAAQLCALRKILELSRPMPCCCLRWCARQGIRSADNNNIHG